MLKITEGKAIPWIAADVEKKRDVQEVGLEAAMKGIARRAKEKVGEGKW